MKTSNPSRREFQDQLVDGRPLYELVGEKVAQWGASCMGDSYSYIGAVVGATYPEMGKVLRKLMPKTFILVPGYGAQGGKGADLVHFFNEDGLGAIVNSSRGIIAAYKQDAYKHLGAENFADAARCAVKDMAADIDGALKQREITTDEDQRELYNSGAKRDCTGYLQHVDSDREDSGNCGGGAVCVAVQQGQKPDAAKTDQSL